MAGNDVHSLAQAAGRLLRTGPVAEAVEAYRRLLSVRPDAPDDWYDLGHLLTRARRFEEALGAYGEAIARGLRAPEEAHVNCSVILDHLERQPEAEAQLRRAIEARPGFVPALLNLGNMAEDRGSREGARGYYERVLEADPRNATALARLAAVSQICGPRDPIIARIKGALRAGGVSAIDRASLGFALGQALDAAGAYDDAFAAFVAANAANREAGGVRYDPRAHEALIDRLIATFPLQKTAGGDEGGNPPIFICGMFRSGSTLTERMLSRHSQITAGGELDLLPTIVRQLRAYPESLASVDGTALAAMRRSYCDGLRLLHADSKIVTDKRPDNFLHIGLIKSLFPSARIVHTVRDSMDNCLSIFALHLHPRMAYANDLGDIGHWYKQYRRLMLHWRKLYGDDIHDVDYDVLVSRPEEQVESLLAFCGLSWEPGVLDFTSGHEVVKTASVWQVREPLYRRSSGRSSNYERHLEPLAKILRDL